MLFDFVLAGGWITPGHNWSPQPSFHALLGRVYFSLSPRAWPSIYSVAFDPNASSVVSRLNARGAQWDVITWDDPNQWVFHFCIISIAPLAFRFLAAALWHCTVLCEISAKNPLSPQSVTCGSPTIGLVRLPITWLLPVWYPIMQIPTVSHPETHPLPVSSARPPSLHGHHLLPCGLHGAPGKVRPLIYSEF